MNFVVDNNVILDVVFDLKREATVQKPFFDLKKQFRKIAPTIEKNIDIALNNGRYILGPEVKELEHQLVNYTKTEHCISVSSGTDALLMPLMAWDIWPGDVADIKSEAEDRGVYIRLGSSTRQAGPEFIAEMKRLGEGISFDRLPRPELTVDDLNIKAIQKAFQAVNQEITDEKLVSLGLLVPYIGNLVPSNGGIILFGSDSARERYFPDARVSCALFEGADKANFLDRIDIDGGVFSALTEVPKFVRRNSRLAANIKSFQRKDVPAYSTVALREVLTNAIAHTDYSLAGMRIMVAIFSDRLEVQSPGILPFGMTLDNFRAGTSIIRNHTIAKVLRHLSLMEEWGSGYRRIETSCTENGYDIPEWFEIGPTIRVVLPQHPLTIQKATEVYLNDVPINDPINVPINKRQQWFLEQLKQGFQCKPANIVVNWGVVEKTAKRDISDLQRKGLVKFVGALKTGTYQLIENLGDKFNG